MGNLRRYLVVQPTCTVRCSYISPLTVGPALRFGSFRKLFNTNRFGNSSKCRRTTTRKLITNVGTTVGILNERPIVFSHSRDCVNALISSLIAGNTGRPCEVVASEDRCELMLHRSGTSRELAPLNREVNLVDSRECTGFLGGRRLGGRRLGELGDAIVSPASRMGRVLISHRASRVASNMELVSLVGHPRLNCSTLGGVSGAEPRLSPGVFRRIRVRVGCRNCVRGRLGRIRRVGGLRIGRLPGSFSCGRVRKLQLRTERGLGGVGPLGVKRTSEVSNISPTSVDMLLV